MASPPIGYQHYGRGSWFGADVLRQLESVKHLFWQGNTEALERMTSLSIDLSLIRAHSADAAKIPNELAEFETYIPNNRVHQTSASGGGMLALPTDAPTGRSCR